MILHPTPIVVRRIAVTVVVARIVATIVPIYTCNLIRVVILDGETANVKGDLQTNA
jgi:hypothetical protein